MARIEARIYSATYSNVPVFEFNVGGNHVMRRRADNWINATHILKVAEYDKPTRTRILEREVQKGVHEKVQGGYGKYQGTWIPLPEGRVLAERNGVLEKLSPILDFVAGDNSPPPAPKHATAASKPRVQRAPAQQRRVPPPAAASAATYAPHNDYERIEIPTSEMAVDTPDNDTIASESAFGDYDTGGYPSSRKRRRLDNPRAQAETQRRLWADELLDYFMLKENSEDAPSQPPLPPADADLNLPIDEKGHTPLHWAAAMGDIDVVKDLIRRGAAVEVQSLTGETPLMFATLYTNCSDKQVMERLVSLLVRTVSMQEWCGGTVFHVIATTTERKSKYQAARYYMDCVLNKMIEYLAPGHVEEILNQQDHNGDTAVTIAARNGARKCVRSLIGRNAAVDIPNHVHETADQYIVKLNHRRQERLRQGSSSPFQGADGYAIAGASHGHNGFPIDPLNPHASLNGASMASSLDGVYRSEAALTLTSQIMPSVFSKAKQLATSFDAETAEKEAELGEARRLVDARQSELTTLQRQVEELRSKEMEQTGSVANTDDVVASQLGRLEMECMALMEADQDTEIRGLYNEQHDEQVDFNGRMEKHLDGDASEAMTALARETIWLKGERHRLMQDVLKKVSHAGIDNGKHAQYVRLIRGALGIDGVELQDVLPDIVDELENGRAMEVAGT